ncbi:MAG: dehydrogenase [Myxococcales bacterium]|nr:dehydrogenase [Myxococcales bacterium]
MARRREDRCGRARRRDDENARVAIASQGKVQQMPSLSRKHLILIGLLAVLAAVTWLEWRRSDPTLPPSSSAPPLPKLAVSLRQIAAGFREITDLAAVPAPHPATLLVVVEKPGTAHLLDTATGKRWLLLQKAVATASEEGLLGLAFDPQFAVNRRFYTNSVVTEGGQGKTTRPGNPTMQDKTTIDAWLFPLDALGAEPAQPLWRVLSFDQPYANHNAGQLAFGPDGMLYIGTGDGGSGGDPHGHAQNPRSWLGKMLRIDVAGSTAAQPYRVPTDNPFVGNTAYLPEIWATGLRNPWRYSFDDTGRLWVGDVGQNAWEEIDLVERGANLGWNVREGRHCFAPPAGCSTAGLVDPVWEGAHPSYVSLTGGFVYAGVAIPALRGKYVFGDFLVGRLWAIEPPAVGSSTSTAQFWLTDHGLMVTTLGRRRDGELWVGDFKGTVWLLVP